MDVAQTGLITRARRRALALLTLSICDLGGFFPFFTAVDSIIQATQLVAFAFRLESGLFAKWPDVRAAFTAVQLPAGLLQSAAGLWIGSVSVTLLCFASCTALVVRRSNVDESKLLLFPTRFIAGSGLVPVLSGLLLPLAARDSSSGQQYASAISWCTYSRSGIGSLEAWLCDEAEGTQGGAVALGVLLGLLVLTLATLQTFVGHLPALYALAFGGQTEQQAARSLSSGGLLSYFPGLSWTAEWREGSTHNSRQGTNGYMPVSTLGASDPHSATGIDQSIGLGARTVTASPHGTLSVATAVAAPHMLVVKSVELALLVFVHCLGESGALPVALVGAVTGLVAFFVVVQSVLYQPYAGLVLNQVHSASGMLTLWTLFCHSLAAGPLGASRAAMVWAVTAPVAFVAGAEFVTLSRQIEASIVMKRTHRLPSLATPLAFALRIDAQARSALALFSTEPDTFAAVNNHYSRAIRARNPSSLLYTLYSHFLAFKGDMLGALTQLEVAEALLTREADELYLSLTRYRYTLGSTPILGESDTASVSDEWGSMGVHMGTWHINAASRLGGKSSNNATVLQALRELSSEEARTTAFKFAFDAQTLMADMWTSLTRSKVQTTELLAIADSLDTALQEAEAAFRLAESLQPGHVATLREHAAFLLDSTCDHFAAAKLLEAADEAEDRASKRRIKVEAGPYVYQGPEPSFDAGAWATLGGGLGDAVGVLLVGLDQVIRKASAGACLLFGYTKGDVERKHLAAFMPADLAVLVDAQNKSAASNRSASLIGGDGAGGAVGQTGMVSSMAQHREGHIFTTANQFTITPQGLALVFVNRPTKEYHFILKPPADFPQTFGRTMGRFLAHAWLALPPTGYMVTAADKGTMHALGVTASDVQMYNVAFEQFCPEIPDLCRDAVSRFFTTLTNTADTGGGAGLSVQQQPSEGASPSRRLQASSAPARSPPGPSITSRGPSVAAMAAGVSNETGVSGQGNRQAGVAFDMPLGAEVVRLVNLGHSVTPTGVALATMRLQYVCVPHLLRDIPGVFIVSWRILDGPQEYAISNSGMPDAEASEVQAAESSVFPHVQASNQSLEPTRSGPKQPPGRAPERQVSRQAMSNSYLRSPPASRDATVGKFSSLPGATSGQSIETQAGAPPASDVHEAVGLNDSHAEHVVSTGLSSASEGQNDVNGDSQVRVQPGQTSAEPVKPLQAVSATVSPVVGTVSFLARPSFFNNESNRFGLPLPGVQEEKPKIPVSRQTAARSSVNSSILALDGLPGWSSESKGQGEITAAGALEADAPPMPLLIPPPVTSASIISESPVNHPHPRHLDEEDAGAAADGVSPRRQSNVNFADAKYDRDRRRKEFASPLASPHTGMHHHGHDDRMSKNSGDDTGSAASFNSARAANALRAHIEARRQTLDPSLHAVRVWLLGVVLLVCAALLVAMGTVWVFSTEAEDALQRAHECQLVRTAVLDVSAAIHSIVLLAATGVGPPVHLLNRMSMPYVQALQAEALSSGRMAAPSSTGRTDGVQGIAMDSTGHMQPAWGSLTHSEQRSVVGNATITLLVQTSDVLSVWVAGLVGASLPLSRVSQGGYVERGSDDAHVLRHMHSVSSTDTVPLSVTALDMGVGLTAAEAGLAYGPAPGFVSVTGRVGVPSEIRREVRLPAAALEMSLALRAVARAVESLGLPSGLSNLPSLTSKAEFQYVMRNLEPSLLVALGKLQGGELQHAGRSINNAYLSNFLLILCVLCLTDVVLVTGLVPLTHSVHSATINTVRLLLLLPRPTLKALAGRSKKSKARLTEMMRISLDLREAGDASDEEGGGGGDIPAWAEGQRAQGGATSPHAGPIVMPKDPDAIDLDAGGISMFYQQRSGKTAPETSPKAVGQHRATAHWATDSFLISPNAGMPSPRWNSQQNYSPRKITPHQMQKHAEQQARLLSAYPLFLKLMTAFSLPQLVVMVLVAIYWLWVTVLLTPLVDTATLVAVQQERAVTASRLVASTLVAVVLSSSGNVHQGDAYNATEALVRHLADAVESQSYILQEGSEELGYASTASLHAAIAELESSNACKVFHSALPEASGTWKTASRSTPDLPASSAPYRTTVLSWFWSSPHTSRVFRYIDYMSRGQLPSPEGLGESPLAAIITSNTAGAPLSGTQSSPILDASGAVPTGLYAHACGRVVNGILTRGIGPATDLLVQYGREAVERSTLQQRSQAILNCTLPGPYLAGLLQAGGRSAAEVQSVLTAPAPLPGDAGTDRDCAGSVRRRLAAEASFLEPMMALDRTVLRYVLHAPTAGIAVKLHHWLYVVRVAYTVCTVGTILLLILFHHRAYSYVLQYVNEKLLRVRALLLLIPQEQVKRFPALQAGIGQVTKGIRTAHWLTSTALERTKPHHQLHDHGRARRGSAVGMLSPGAGTTQGALISPSAAARALPRW